MFLKNLIVGCIFLMLAGNATSSDALPPGVMEGHLKILSRKPVDIGDENAATVTAENYADYPTDRLEPRRQKRNRAGDRGRKWKLSHCTAARGLCSGRARVAAQARALEAATIHGCLESDCPRRYGY